MKTTGCRVGVAAFLLLFSFSTQGQVPTLLRSAGSTNESPVVSARVVPKWRVKKQSDHQTEWSTVRYMTNPATGRVRALTNSYVELGTGLNRRDSSGRWQRSSDAFQITTNGAEAMLGQHRVRLARNINTPGAVLIEKGATRMQAHPLCVAYYDPVDGRSELIAEIKDAVGWLVSSNEVVYSNCFNGIQASIRYRNSRSGVEQDLILHERLPVTPEQFGFSDRTRLEIFTEWTGDTPMPVKETRVIQEEKTVEARQAMVEPRFEDQTLKFGELRIGSGRAFTENTGTMQERRLPPNIVPVGKRFEIIDGRKILIEAVPMRNARVMMEKLPVARSAAGVTNAGLHHRLATNGTVLAKAAARAVVRSLPPKRLAKAANSTDLQIQTAAIRTQPVISDPTSPEAVQTAFVLDWYVQLDSALTDFTFRGDNTYLCSGTVDLYGTTTFEAGTVVKYVETDVEPYSILQIYGPINCQTEAYRPAFFTSWKDNTVGEVLSSGTPGRYFQALAIGSTGQSLKHIRVAYADWAIHSYQVNVRHSQITHSGVAFANDGYESATVANVLVHDVDTVFLGYDFNYTGTHVTASDCDNLTGTYAGFPPDWCSVTLNNSLLVNVASPGTVTAIVKNTTQDWPPPSGTAPFPFDTMVTTVAGRHYLATDSLARGAGDPNVDPGLFAEMKETSTHPPIVLSGTISSSQTLKPRPIRFAPSTPDLGYAYDTLDYTARSVTVENWSTPVTLLATNGVVVGLDPSVAGYALYFGANAVLASEGLPSRPNRFPNVRAVLEDESMMLGAGYSTSIGSYSVGATPNARLRFTELPQNSGWNWHFSGDGFRKLDIQDCAIKGGFWDLGFNDASQKIGITNSLIRDVVFTVYADVEAHFRNNLFKNGFISIDVPSGFVRARTVFDNLFDGITIEQFETASITHDYNAYALPSGALPLLTAGVHDRTLPASPAYAIGPFGSFYLPANATQLINQGSVTDAKEVGLFHYTTQVTPQTREGNSRLDIGLHYVASSAINEPLDTDGEGLADYVEDRDGDNALDSGETNYQDVDTDYDGRSDRQELAEDGTNPLDAASVKQVRLGYWRFNNTSWLGEAGQQPLAVLGSLSNPSSWSGKALGLNNASPANLKYRDVEAGGSANINCRQGTIRFWFKPDWLENVGPGGVGRLVEMGNLSNPAEGWWGLSVTPPNPMFAGIKFETRSPGGVVTEHFSAPIQWISDGWHRFTLTYGPSGVAVDVREIRVDQGAVNAQQFSFSGPGITGYPNGSERALHGFSIGSNRTGGEQAKGQFEELETFNYALSSEEIDSSYASIGQGASSMRVGVVASYVQVSDVTFNFLHGPSAEFAILVDNNNFASANWLPYLPSATVNIGNVEGPHDVWFGFRDIAENVTWWKSRVYLDTTPPTLTITTPSGATDRPSIQVMGNANEPLAGVTFDVVNADGIVVDQKGYVLGNVYNPVGGQFIRTDIQCFDVALAVGNNTVTIRATDLAGNTGVAVRSFDFGTANDTTPPSISVAWPPNNTLVSGDTFTLTGTLDDGTASVKITGLASEAISGMVERNGRFTFSGLPLAGGSHNFTITATDAAGNSSQSSRMVQKSSLNLQMTPVSPIAAAGKRATITGVVGSGVSSVTVNGVVAPVNNGEWTASDVPATFNGQKGILIVAVDPTTQQPVQTYSSLEKAPIVRISRYFEDSGFSAGSGVISYNRDVLWSKLEGGSSIEVDHFDNEVGGPVDRTRTFQWLAEEEGPPEMTTVPVQSPSDWGLPWNDGLETKVPLWFGDVSKDYVESGQGQHEHHFAATELEVQVGDEESPNSDIALLVTASAKEFEIIGFAQNQFEGTIPIPGENILLNGQPMQPHPEDPNKGVGIITVPSGKATQLDIRALPQGLNQYSFKVEDLARIDIQEVISDQIAGNECNKLPTAVFPHPNNPMLMATRSGLDTRLAVRIDFPVNLAGKIYVGVRRIGTKSILGSAVAQASPNRTLLQFNAISDFSTDVVYEVVAGYDENSNGALDNPEAVIVFSKTPKGKATAADIKNRLDKIVLVTPSRITYAKAILLGGGNWPSTDYAGDLLDAFVDGSATIPTAIPTTGVPLSSTHPSLSHPAGATWNASCQATTLRFTFPDGVEASNDFEASKALLQIIDSTVLANLSTLIASGSSDFAISATMPFSQFIDFKVTEAGQIGFNELHFAFGRVTVDGSLRVNYRKVGNTLIEVSEVDATGSFDDLYDFNRNNAFPSGLASAVQAGHATISTPPSGRVFFTRLEFNTGWRPHSKSYP